LGGDNDSLTVCHNFDTSYFGWLSPPSIFAIEQYTIANASVVVTILMCMLDKNLRCFFSYSKLKKFVKSTIFSDVMMSSLIEICLNLQGENALEMDAVCLSDVKY
jgi:hypothetical protein